MDVMASSISQMASKMMTATNDTETDKKEKKEVDVFTLAEAEAEKEEPPEEEAHMDRVQLRALARIFRLMKRVSFRVVGQWRYVNETQKRQFVQQEDHDAKETPVSDLFQDTIPRCVYVDTPWKGKRSLAELYAAAASTRDSGFMRPSDDTGTLPLDGASARTTHPHAIVLFADGVVVRVADTIRLPCVRCKKEDCEFYNSAAWSWCCFPCAVSRERGKSNASASVPWAIKVTERGWICSDCGIWTDTRGPCAICIKQRQK
jgi:hypothetical protein